MLSGIRVMSVLAASIQGPIGPVSSTTNTTSVAFDPWPGIARPRPRSCTVIVVSSPDPVPRTFTVVGRAPRPAEAFGPPRRDREVREGVAVRVPEGRRPVRRVHDDGPAARRGDPGHVHRDEDAEIV